MDFIYSNTIVYLMLFVVVVEFGVFAWVAYVGKGESKKSLPLLGLALNLAAGGSLMAALGVSLTLERSILFPLALLCGAVFHAADVMYRLRLHRSNS